MSGRVALVTGASRGVGLGIATGLGEAGWTVYLSGRGPADAGTPLADAAEQVRGAGGTAVPVVCDHHVDAQVTALVERCVAEQGHLDLLVNNVWAGPGIDPAGNQPLWERPLSDWDALIGLGLRSHVVASAAACRHMVPRGSGLIVTISSFGARGYLHSVLYGVAKAGLDKLTADLAHELTGHGVTALSLWPGLVRTPALLSRGITEIAGIRVDDGETPQFQGRVVHALADDPEVQRWSGAALVSAEVGEHYGILDVDGRRPRSLRAVFGGGPLFADPLQPPQESQR